MQTRKPDKQKGINKVQKTNWNVNLKKTKKILKDTSVCVTHCGVIQLRTMRPLASLSFVSSWDRELRLSTSHSLPLLAKILPCFNHQQYWLWCQSMGGRELSHYRYVSLNILRHAHHA